MVDVVEGRLPNFKMNPFRQRLSSCREYALKNDFIRYGAVRRLYDRTV